MWVMSDRGLPRSYATMAGFGVNTYTLLNAAGERHFVKFHWIPELGVHSLMWDEALKICGQDPGQSLVAHRITVCRADCALRRLPSQGS
jgi:catalase